MYESKNILNTEGGMLLSLIIREEEKNILQLDKSRGVTIEIIYEKQYEAFKVTYLLDSAFYH